jgi:hypothetical protein
MDMSIVTLEAHPPTTLTPNKHYTNLPKNSASVSARRKRDIIAFATNCKKHDHSKTYLMFPWNVLILSKTDMYIY